MSQGDSSRDNSEQEQVAREVHLVYSQFDESPSDEYECQEIPIGHCENRQAGMDPDGIEGDT